MLFNYIDLIFIDLMTKLVFHIEKRHFILKKLLYMLLKNPEIYIRHKQVAYSFMKRIAGLRGVP